MIRFLGMLIFAATVLLPTFTDAQDTRRKTNVEIVIPTPKPRVAAAAPKKGGDVVPLPPGMIDEPPATAAAPPAPPPPPVIISPPPVTVTTTEPAQSLLELIIPNLLSIVLAALGVTLSPQLLMIVQKLLIQAGTIAETRLREKLETTVLNGGAAATAEGATSKEQFINKVVGYTLLHAKDTIKKLGGSISSGETSDALRAITEKLLQAGKWDIKFPTIPQPSGGSDAGKVLAILQDLIANKRDAPDGTVVSEPKGVG